MPASLCLYHFLKASLKHRTHDINEMTLGISNISKQIKKSKLDVTDIRQRGNVYTNVLNIMISGCTIKEYIRILLVIILM